MRTIFIWALFIAELSFAQNDLRDSLNRVLEKSPRDTNRVKVLLTIGELYFFSKPDTCLFYSKLGLELAKTLDFTKGEIRALNNMGESLRFLGDYPAALRTQLEALEVNRAIKDLNGEAGCLGFIGLIYIELREYRQALSYLLLSWKINRQVSNQIKETFDLTNIGHAYDLLGMSDSAFYYQQEAWQTYTGLNHGPLKSLVLTRLGNAYLGIGLRDSALQLYHRSLANAFLVDDKVNPSKIRKKIAELFLSTDQTDSSLYYARLAFLDAKAAAQKLDMLESGELLVKLYRKKQETDSAFYFQDIAMAMKDSLYGPQKFKQLQLLMLEEQQRQQVIVQEQGQFRNKIRYTALISSLVVFLILALLLFRNNRNKQKANVLLKKQKDKIEESLSELRSTQAQLIQSEKMASLGQLTAGIAHEIQNPLNFVNNFSEVNTELLDELRDELAIGNKQQAIEIVDNIKQNSEKINHHGKRADAIVKGMLQHSQTSNGQKESTDINALAEEFLRLSYRSFQTKEKSAVEIKLITDIEKSLPAVLTTPQEIGRVFLNLFNNAFWAVNEKLKTVGVLKEYQPTISLTTKNLNDHVEIRIADNGIGIPSNIQDKIFQPFFTTKPTGQGTGLGLSLAYDIVKALGGTIVVNTNYHKLHKELLINSDETSGPPDNNRDEQAGTEFIIRIPVN
ncbi:MAG: ATP-binding protein [Saprospiraceae bacterium]